MAVNSYDPLTQRRPPSLPLTQIVGLCRPYDICLADQHSTADHHCHGYDPEIDPGELQRLDVNMLSAEDVTPQKASKRSTWQVVSQMSSVMNQHR